MEKRETAVGDVRIRSDGTTADTKVEVFTNSGWLPLNCITKFEWKIEGPHGLADAKLSMFIRDINLATAAQKVVIDHISTTDSVRVVDAASDKLTSSSMEEITRLTTATIAADVAELKVTINRLLLAVKQGNNRPASLAGSQAA